MTPPARATDLDPRLLQWLHLLLQEGSVSRAALRAHVTQSAMSHALRQMRAVAPQPGFDPAVGAHAFRIAMPDYGDLVLAPALLSRQG